MSRKRWAKRLAAGLLVLLAGLSYWQAGPLPLARAARDDESAANDEPADQAHADEGTPSVADGEIQLPKGWPPGAPIPQVKSNCVVCHLNAGRELTLAVRDFAHSTHDLNDLTCSDCHGGNREIDARAHEDEFGFIGTKLSAHMTQCASCHEEQATALTAGPHAWDFSKRINTDYPMCFDCHGNHAVGNRSEKFSLTQMCQDCHDDFENAMADWAALSRQNDALGHELAKVRSKWHAGEPVWPEGLADEIEGLRHETMQWMHGCGKLSKAEAAALVERSKKLQSKLQSWLAKAD